MQEINFGIIAVRESKEDAEKVEILHFIGYESEPELTEDFLNQLYLELLQENVFGMDDGVDLAICPPDILEHYKKLYTDLQQQENTKE